MKHILMLPLLLAIAGGVQASAQPADARDAENAAALDTALAGLTPSEPVGCISQLRRVRVPRITAYGDTLVFRVNAKLSYVSQTGGGCGNVAQGDSIATQTPTGRLCRGDVAQVFDRYTRQPTGGCSLGDFVPYRAP